MRNAIWWVEGRRLGVRARGKRNGRKRPKKEKLNDLSVWEDKDLITSALIVL